MKGPDWLPYVLPMGLFLALTTAEGMGALAPYYPGLYALKAALVTIALCVCARAWRAHVRVDGRSVGIGLLAGAVGIVAWIGLERVTPGLPFLPQRTAFDPYQEILDPSLRLAFLAVRFYGLALMVPVMEEVFWRAFALRFLTDQDRWKALPLPAFSWGAAGIVSVIFAAIHARTEWLAALVFAALMALALRRTGSLLACIVAHATTNLALGIYILLTREWRYW